MSAKSIDYQQYELRMQWDELWLNMADGDVTKFNELKRLDIRTFYRTFDHWHAMLKKKINQR